MDKKFFIKSNAICFAIVLSVIIIEISLTVMTYYLMKNNDNNAIKKIMSNTNNNLMEYIDLKLREAMYIIQKNAAFFRSSRHFISSADYRDLLQISNFPSRQNIQSYIWIRKLPNSSLDVFENYCKANIIDNCTIKQLIIGENRTFRFERVQGKEYYYPLIFADPPFNESIQAALIGLDLTSYNGTADIINIALSIPNITATYRINLAGLQPNNPYSFGMLLSYPSFIESDNYNTSEILGIASAYIRVGDIIEGAIHNLDLTVDDDDIDIFVFDITDDNYTGNYNRNLSLIHHENKYEYQNVWFPSNITEGPATSNHRYQLSTRLWSIYFKYNQKFIDKNRSTLLIIVPSIMTSAFILLNIIFIILYNLISSLKQKKDLEVKKKNISMQMLRYVNHEIRNPLNIIKGLSLFTFEKIKDMDNGQDKIYFDKKVYDTVISDLSTVCGSCDMLEHIVTDILDIDKLDSGKLNLNNEWVKIHAFMKDIEKSISQKIDEKQTIKLEKIYDKKLILFFDNYRMKQILINFLTNSIKYTNNGKITIKIEDNTDSYRISVSDTGRGILDDDKLKIFQPFDLTSADDAARYGGVGLGLYLCKMLTERMGGTIGFESQYRKGSTFWVDFKKSQIKPVQTV